MQGENCMVSNRVRIPYKKSDYPSLEDMTKLSLHDSKALSYLYSS